MAAKYRTISVEVDKKGGKAPMSVQAQYVQNLTDLAEMAGCDVGNPEVAAAIAVLEKSGSQWGTLKNPDSEKKNERFGSGVIGNQNYSLDLKARADAKSGEGVAVVRANRIAAIGAKQDAALSAKLAELCIAAAGSKDAVKALDAWLAENAE